MNYYINIYTFACFNSMLYKRKPWIIKVILLLSLFSLSYPVLNSTNRLVQQLEEAKNAVFSNKQVLEEISDVNMQTHSKLNHLDYDLNDRRYASLTSLSSQVKTTLPRTQRKLKKQDENLQPPLIEDLKFLAEYDTENAKIDYKVDFGCASESGDDFDYLFDLYKNINFL